MGRHWQSVYHKNAELVFIVFLIEHLSYVTELTDLIKSKSSPEQSGVDDSANFVGFFPIFVWALRDFSLELEANGKPITADEYLEHSLTLKKGTRVWWNALIQRENFINAISAWLTKVLIL